MRLSCVWLTQRETGQSANTNSKLSRYVMIDVCSKKLLVVLNANRTKHISCMYILKILFFTLKIIIIIAIIPMYISAKKRKTQFPDYVCRW